MTIKNILNIVKVTNQECIKFLLMVTALLEADWQLP